MNYKSDEAQLVQLAANVLEARAAAIRAGVSDPEVAKIAGVVQQFFDGDLEAAEKSLLAELKLRTQAAYGASLVFKGVESDER